MTKVASIPGEETAKVLVFGNDIPGTTSFESNDPLYEQSERFARQINETQKLLHGNIQGPVCPYLKAILEKNCIFINPIQIKNTQTDLLELLKGEFDRVTKALEQIVLQHYGRNYYTQKSDLDLFVMISPIIHTDSHRREFCEEMTFQYNLQRDTVIHAGHMMADVNPFRESGGGGRTSGEQEAESYFKSEDGGAFMFMFKKHDSLDDQFMRTPRQIEYHFDKYPALKVGHNPYRQDTVANLTTQGVYKHIAEGYEIIELIDAKSNPIEIVNKLYEKCLFETPEPEIRGLIHCFSRDLEFTRNYLKGKMKEAEQKYDSILKTVFIS